MAGAREAPARYDAAAEAAGWVLEAAGPVEAEGWAAPVADDALAGAAGGLAEAVDALAEAVDGLAGVDLTLEGDRTVGDAALLLQRLADRLASQQLRLLGAVDRRGIHTLDGAVSAASWYRFRTRVDHHAATRRVEAARRLEALPAFAEALQDGQVTLEHALAVTKAAAPRRMPAIAAAEPILVQLAKTAQPRTLRLALRRIADIVDPDGTDTPPLAEVGSDERRHLDTWVGIDGLVEICGLLDQIDGEALLTALDALETPDPPDTPARRRRSPGQRRADALGVLARRVLDAGDTPTVHGNKPHLLLSVDLATLITPGHQGRPDTWMLDRLGPDGLAGLTSEQIQHLLAQPLQDLIPNPPSGPTSPAVHGDPPSSPSHPGGHDQHGTGQVGDWPSGAGLLTGQGEHPADSHHRIPLPQPGNAQPGNAQPGNAQPGNAQPGNARTGPNQRAGPHHNFPPIRPTAGRHNGTPTGPAETLQPSRHWAGPGGTRQPRLHYTGELSPQRAQHLALQAKVTAVLTMGPWRTVNVGRTMRTLPSWLRPVLAMIHRRCRGPDCDRPPTWTQAHHQDPWAHGGHTDINRIIPLCHAHHNLITTGGWNATFDPDTGVCTWTSPDGRTIHTHPPPP